MARFYSHEEIQKDLILDKEYIGTLAQKIEKLPSFDHGHAVIFGSVARGTQRDRSDLDVAWPGIDDGYFAQDQSQKIDFHVELTELFAAEFGKYGDIIKKSLVQILENQTTDKKGRGDYGLQKGFKIFPSTRDHFETLAKIKGGKYTSFFDLYIQDNTVQNIERKTEFEEYVEKMFNLTRITDLSLYQMAQIENFPKHVMRKYLALYELLPEPDTFENTWKIRQNLESRIPRETTPLFTPFFQLEEKYDQIVSTVKKDNLSEARYLTSLRELFESLVTPPIRRAIFSSLLKGNVWFENDYGTHVYKQHHEKQTSNNEKSQ